MNDQEFSYLKNKILTLTQIDLNYYKGQQMRRRLEGFIERTQVPGIIPYCKVIERDNQALAKLLDFLTINVTEFFRDQEQFELMKSRILPELLKAVPKLNIWSAGCSQGAEPYSMAILLAEISPRQIHRILATDIDGRVLTKARSGGPYTPADVKNVKQVFLQKYFTRSDSGYLLNDNLRRRVEFRQHNLLRDSFETDFDLVIFRNVGIYFSEEAKAKLNQQFCRSLKEGGVMFIGGTESLLDAQQIGLDRIFNGFFRKRSDSKNRKRERAIPFLLPKY